VVFVLNFVLSSNPLTLSYKGEPFISFSESLQLLHKTAMMFNFSIFLCGNCFDAVGRIIDHHYFQFSVGFVLLILYLCSLPVFSGVCVIDSVPVFTSSFKWGYNTNPTENWK
jgi:hypothetical protein